MELWNTIHFTVDLPRKTLEIYDIPYKTMALYKKPRTFQILWDICGTRLKLLKL